LTWSATRARLRLQQVGWLIAIWTASVAALALAAIIFRGIMAAAGLTT